MTNSPYSDSASTYREQGLSVIPCGPGTKFPGRYTAADGWWKAHDWQKYCDRLPTGFEMEIWERWPDAGICLVLGASSAPAGKILVAVDIDTVEPDEVAAIRSVIPGSPVAKAGAKGETQFYLANPCVLNAAFNDGNKRRMLDLLAHGRQTVMPPTIHPDTGQPYRWLTPDTLEFFSVADLPELPDDIVERLGKALEPFGYAAPPKLGEAGEADLSGEKVHRSLNDAALANLDAWVPELGLYKCRKVGVGYKAVADWRPSSSGRPLAKRATNLAIRYDGIKDCGDNRGYTPLDLVMDACGCDLETAFRWLQERVAKDRPVILATSNPDPAPEPAERPERAALPSCEPEEPSIVRTSPKGNLAGLSLVTSNGALVAPPPPPAEPVVPDAPTVIPEEYCTPPGLLGDIVRWIVAAEDRPVPQLGLGAALAYVGALMGQRWAHPSKSARTNFYCVGVAPTGYGKQHAITAVKELANAANTPKAIGPGRFKSESSVRSLLEKKPTVACFMDEAGGAFRDILGKHSSEHKQGIRDILLELFSSANTTYTGAEAAATEAVAIRFPNLCIYGTSTPTDLWGNVTGSAAADGFLPRWLVFEPSPKKARRRKPTATIFEVDGEGGPPEALRLAIRNLLDAGYRGNLNGVTTIKPINAKWGPGAEEWFADCLDRTEAVVDAANDAKDTFVSAVASRSVEHIAKLSLVYAVGLNPPAPVITVESLQWAEGVVRHSTNALITALKGKVADNDFQAQFKRVWGLIQEHGTIKESEFFDILNGEMETRRIEDILAQLKRAGRINDGLVSTAKGGRLAKRIWVVKREAEAG